MNRAPELFRVLDHNGTLHRADDGRTRFAYFEAHRRARMVRGKVVK